MCFWNDGCFLACFFAMRLRVFNHFHLFDRHVLPFGYPGVRCVVPANIQIEMESVQSRD